MNITAKSTGIEQCKNNCVVVGVFTNGQLSPSAAYLEKNSHISFSELYKNQELTGKVGQLLSIHQPCDQFSKAIIVGLGSEQSLNEKRYRNAINNVTKLMTKQSSTKISVFLDEVTVDGCDSTTKANVFAEKLIYHTYQFTACKSDVKKPRQYTVHFHSNHLSDAKKGISHGVAVGRGVNIARDLGDLPGNICTPTYLSKQAKKLARQHSSVITKVLSEKQMTELGMGSLLSVSAGSKEPAQLIVMEYKGGAKNQRPHVLVGKGITFDTGGISLKPGAAMDEMKYDMCGAASVFGTMNTIAELAPNINVVAIVAAAENMPSSTATKPGDIVTAMSGKTIEVLNTDAEGRLVLCDALTYAERYKPQSVIDIATLTGACVVALGGHATGLFSNNETLAKELLDAGVAADDRAWQLPLWDEYKKQLKSNFADLANIGGRSAGSITAACFLSYFTESYPWAHLDIAGTAWLSGANKGATGRPVPLLTHYLLSKV